MHKVVNNYIGVGNRCTQRKLLNYNVEFVNNKYKIINSKKLYTNDRQPKQYKHSSDKPQNISCISKANKKDNKFVVS